MLGNQTERKEVASVSPRGLQRVEQVIGKQHIIEIQNLPVWTVKLANTLTINHSAHRFNG
jgi:hypothetical protein